MRRRNAHPNYEINEQLGLGDLNDTSDPDYVTAGSRVHYQVETTLSTWDQFSPKSHAQAVANSMNSQPAFSSAIATFPDFVNPLTGKGTLIVELTSRIDRSSIEDIAGNIRQEAAAAGFFTFTGESINFISRAEPGQVPPRPPVGTSFDPNSPQAGTPFDLATLNANSLLGGGSSTLLIVGAIGLVLVLAMGKR